MYLYANSQTRYLYLYTEFGPNPGDYARKVLSLWIPTYGQLFTADEWMMGDNWWLAVSNIVSFRPIIV
jgi:hypothetical protein